MPRIHARGTKSPCLGSRLALVMGVGGLAHCAGSAGVPASPAGVVPESITVTSRSFGPGGTIPVDFTCDGKNTAVEVSWSSPPQDAKAMVVILEDPDALNAPFTHWLALDIRPEFHSIPSGADVASFGGRLGANDNHETGYAGPCPPHGMGHHYALRVIALDQPLGLPEGARRANVDAAMNGHVLGSGQVVATFVR